MKKTLRVASLLCASGLFISTGSSLWAETRELLSVSQASATGEAGSVDQIIPVEVSPQVKSPSGDDSRAVDEQTLPPEETVPPPTAMELGMEALAQKRYADAEKYLNRAAREGEARAQFELGQMYATGLGVKRNPRQGYELLRAAADQGMEEACLMVADSLRDGTGTKKDIPQAVQFYRVLLAMDNPQAAPALVALYRNDRDLAVADPAAARLLTPLAGTGDVEAQRVLAHVLVEGLLPDLDGAVTWLYRASFAGNAKARLELADALRRQSFVDHGAEAMDWVALAARQGDAAGQYEMAVAYRNGIFLPYDNVKAFLWMQRAAAAGYPKALAMQGDVYARGMDGVRIDTEWAWLLFDAAAARGDQQAAEDRDVLGKKMRRTTVSALKGQSKKWQALWLPKSAQDD